MFHYKPSILGTPRFLNEKTALGGLLPIPLQMVRSGTSRVNPLTTSYNWGSNVLTYLVSGMNHQVTIVPPSHYSFRSRFGHRPRSTQPHRAILRVQVQTSLQLDVTAHSVTQLSGWTRGSGQVQCFLFEQIMLVKQ